jgi:hypothetical protein
MVFYQICHQTKSQIKFLHGCHFGIWNSTKYYPNKNRMFSKVYYCSSFQDIEGSGSTAASVSKICVSTMLSSKIRGNQKVWNEVFSSGLIFITRFLKIAQQVQKRSVQWGRWKTERERERERETKYSVLKTLRFSVLGRELTDWITPWSTVLLERLTGTQYPVIYRTWKFITAFTCPYPAPNQSSPCPPPIPLS